MHREPESAAFFAVGRDIAVTAVVTVGAIAGEAFVAQLVRVAIGRIRARLIATRSSDQGTELALVGGVTLTIDLTVEPDLIFIVRHERTKPDPENGLRGRCRLECGKVSS